MRKRCVNKNSELFIDIIDKHSDPYIVNVSGILPVCAGPLPAHIVRHKDVDHFVIVVHGVGKCIGLCKVCTHTSCSVTCIFLFDAFHYSLQACSEIGRHWDFVVTI